MGKNVIKILAVACLLGFTACKDSSKYGDGPKQGPKGVQGVKGEKGDQGPKGETGEMGPTGPVGPRGLQGPKGEKGDRGLTGPKGDRGPAGQNGLDGRPGLDGKDGKDAPKPQVYLTPTEGKCVRLMSGIYMKNEGRKADFYNNSDCRHGSNDSGVYCNNVVDGEIGSSDREVCVVIFSNQKLVKLTVVGTDEDMCVVEEIIDNLPTYKVLD